MAKLDDLEVGQCARITGFCTQADAEYQQKLLTMGLTQGTEIKVVRRAPLGDPVQILARGSSLLVRQLEASILELEVINEEV